MLSIVYFSLHFTLQSSRNLFLCDSEKQNNNGGDDDDDKPNWISSARLYVPEVANDNDSSSTLAFSRHIWLQRHFIHDKNRLNGFENKKKTKNQRDHMNDGFARRLPTINTFRMFWYFSLSRSASQSQLNQTQWNRV